MLTYFRAKILIPMQNMNYVLSNKDPLIKTLKFIVYLLDLLQSLRRYCIFRVLLV